MTLEEDFDALSVDKVKNLLLAMDGSCRGMDKFNGSGWGCIYNHQPSYNRCQLSYHTRVVRALGPDGPPLHNNDWNRNS
jgi:hypothetical protein